MRSRTMRTLFGAVLLLTSGGCSSKAPSFSVGEYHYRYTVGSGAVTLVTAFDDNEHMYLHLEAPEQQIVVRDRYGNSHTITRWEDYAIVHGLHDELYINASNETDLEKATLVSRVDEDGTIDG